MKREKNKVNFNDLFSEYEAIKAAKKEQNQSRNNLPDVDEAFFTKKSNKINQKNKTLSNVWAFLNKPMSELINKEDNKSSSLKIIKEYKNIYDMFSLFKRDDIKIDYKSILKKVLTASFSVVLASLIMSMIFGGELILLGSFIFVAGMFLFYQQDPENNGIKEEILYRKYKTFLTLMVHMKNELNTKDDFRKLFEVMSNNTDYSLSEEKKNQYTEMMWEYLSKVDISDIDLKNLSKDELIGFLHENFKGLFEKRNANSTNSKEWDQIVEVFAGERIYQDIKTLDNLTILRKSSE